MRFKAQEVHDDPVQADSTIARSSIRCAKTGPSNPLKAKNNLHEDNEIEIPEKNDVTERRPKRRPNAQRNNRVVPDDEEDNLTEVEKAAKKIKSGDETGKSRLMDDLKEEMKWRQHDD